MNILYRELPPFTVLFLLFRPAKTKEIILFMPLHFLIIGSGLSGSVLARELAELLDCQINNREEKHLYFHNLTSMKVTKQKISDE